MKKSDYIEVFVPTHIINANSNPYIENKMIEQTIVSCNSVLKMENVQFTIAPDASFKKSHPVLMKKYEAYLNDMCESLKKINININTNSDLCVRILRYNFRFRNNTN